MARIIAPDKAVELEVVFDNNMQMLMLRSTDKNLEHFGHK
jgi:hypothetical protein